MGRKLNISQPAVIQTELRPLDESFWIDANGGFEQWYYQNTNVFAPDRQITPLILTPHLSAVDLDTNTKYTPTFQLDSWVVKEYIDGAWVTTTITSQSQTSDYVLQGLNLIVKKNNYDATHAINITCKATYQDPRDVGVLKGVEDSVMLVTSVDATQSFPTIDIVNPATRTYNPLKDESPIYEFEGKADWDGVEAQGGTAITECKVDPLGTEEILPTNEEMVLNSAPTLNIHYGDIEKANQKFMYRQTANGEVSEIVGGVSAIDNIKGNTVAWNQFADGVRVSGSNASVSNKTTNGFTLTAPASSADKNASQGSAFVNKDHIYYYGYDYTSTLAFSIQDMNSGSVSKPATSTFSHVSKIGKAVAGSYTSLYWYLYATTSQAWTLVVKNYIVVDLTLIYGAGNEPTTPEEFETWLATNIGKQDYYEYCSGKLVNFGGFGVKWNQLIRNGNYAQGTEHITPQYLDISVSNGVLTSVVSYNNAYASVKFMLATTFVKNHKYYITGKIKVVSITNVSNSISLVLNNGNNQTTNGKNNVVAGLTYDMNSIQTLNTDPTGNNNFVAAYVPHAGGTVGDTFQIWGVNCIDLTLMFGAGNEPDLEWCNKYFSKDYYPYCPSVDRNILDVMTTKEVVEGVAQYKSPEMGVKTTGFNQWDEEWEHKKGYSTGTMIDSSSNIASKNYIPCLQSSTYSITIPNSLSVYVYQYDVNKGFVKTNLCYNNDTIKTESNTCYLKFASTNDAYSGDYNHDICINLSDPSKDGTYEPHWESKSDMSWITKIGIENFNIWDEEWEVGKAINNAGEVISTNSYTVSKNAVPVFPNTNYYFTSQYDLYAYEYDANGAAIGWLNASDNNNCKNRILATKSNTAYLKFMWYGTTYNNDICINLSNPHFNGRYYPHGETAPYFPNGLCKAGSVFDEVKVENGKIKGVVRIGSVDLGSLNWAKQATVNNKWRFISPTVPYPKMPTSSDVKANIVCSKYNNITPTESYIADSAGIAINTTAHQIAVVDSSYSDATTFKAAMQGVMPYYELETPYEFEIDYPTKGQFMWYGVDGSNNEVPIDQLPIYSQATQPSGYGQGTSRININALYGENIPVILRVKRYPWSPTVLPPKVTKSVAWSIPPVDVVTTSDKGSAVRATNSSENFTFSTIVNQQGEIISEEKKAENMVFDWYMVKYGTSGAIKTSLGSGLTKAVAASTLKNTTPSGGVTPSTNIYCEAFLLGAYHLVDGQYVRTKD